MKRFHLIRYVDPTAVSGIGIVAEGVVFRDGRTVLHWLRGPHRTTGLYDSIEAVEAIHGHGGLTQIRWIGQDSKQSCETT